VKYNRPSLRRARHREFEKPRSKARTSVDVFMRAAVSPGQIFRYHVNRYYKEQR
jgi:hypothetical protein